MRVPIKVCSAPGCPQLTTGAYCQLHVSARVSGSRWMKIRKAKLRDSPFCEICGREPSREVDHIVEIQDGGHPTDWDNLQALCVGCHKEKSAERRRLDR